MGDVSTSSASRSPCQSLLCFVLLIMFCIVASSCSSTKTEPPSVATGRTSSAMKLEERNGSEAMPTTTEERASIKGGIICTSVCGFQFMAQKRGFFDEAGLDVEYVLSDNNVNLTKALLAGQLDIIEAAPDIAIVSSAQGGVGIKIIGGSVPKLNWVLFTNDKIKSLEDLSGKRVGISQPGALPQLLVMKALRNAGLDPNGVQWVVAGGNAQVVQALIADKIDATAAPNDFIPQIENHGHLGVLLDFGTDLPDWIRFGMITTDRVIAEKSETLQRFMIAYAKGIRYAIEHPDEGLALAADILDTSPDEPSLVYGFNWNIEHRLVSPDMSVTPESVQFMIDMAKESTQLNDDVTVNDVFDPQFQQGVVRELGAYEW